MNPILFTSFVSAIAGAALAPRVWTGEPIPASTISYHLPDSPEQGSRAPAVARYRLASASAPAADAPPP